MSLYKRLENINANANTNVNIEDRQVDNSGAASIDPYREIKARIHKRIVDEASQNSLLQEKTVDNSRVFAYVKQLCNAIIAEEGRAIPIAERDKIIVDIVDEVLGFGPLETLLQDETVTEIMVNGPSKVYVERAGRLKLTDVKFKDNDHVMKVIERIVTPLGRRIDESSPMVDARLPDGSRVNAIIPPLSISGPCVTIRKFSKKPLTFPKLIEFGAMTENMSTFLQACVKANLNIVVAGGTGSGKTTTLNALSSFIPDGQRIVTIEDAAELQLQQDHIVALESRAANVEGKGAIPIRELVRNALRMRPDRIIVGEVRSGEALDMLQAMNTGHDGCMTTVHANAPRDVLSRVETMVLMAGMELPARAIREQISSAFELIVHQSRLRDGTRKITHITEVQGMEGDVIVLQDLFAYEQQGRNEAGQIVGRFRPTGMRPRLCDKMEANGIHLPAEVFEPEFGRR